MKSLLIKFIFIILLMTVIYVPNNIYAADGTTLDSIISGADNFLKGTDKDSAYHTKCKNCGYEEDRRIYVCKECGSKNLQITNALIDEEALQSTSNLIYNTLFAIAMAVALIIGVILGIQFVTGGATEQAKVKESIIPYVVGVFVVVAAFTIWRVVVSVLGGALGIVTSL